MSRACRRAARWVLLAIDERLSLENAFQLEEHLRECTRCRIQHRQSTIIEDVLQRLVEPSLGAADIERAVDSIGKALPVAGASGTDSAPGPSRWRAPRRVLLGAGLAILLLGAVAVFVRRRTPPTPPVAHVAAHTSPSVATTTSRSSASNAGHSAPESTRLEVRTLLLRALSEASPGSPFLARFDSLRREHRHVGWHVLRLVEACVSDPNRTVARAALRYIGARGDRLSLTGLRDVLADPQLAPDAIDALAALGADGVPLLREALADERLFERAALALVRIGGEPAASALERELAHGAGDDDERRSFLLDALASTGRPASAAFLRLAQSALVTEEEALGRLQGDSGASAELARIVRDEPDRHATPLLLAFVAHLHPAGALAWVARTCTSYEHGRLALECLGTWPAEQALEALLRLDEEGRVTHDDLARVVRRQLQRAAPGVARFTELLLEHERSRAATRWLELLILSADRAAAQALGILALGELLPDGERQLAALAIGELGPGAAITRFRSDLERALPAERRLAASCLLALFAVGGEEATSPITARFSERSRQAVVSALERTTRWGVSSGLTRVTRALDDALSAPSANAWDFMP